MWKVTPQRNHRLLKHHPVFHGKVKIRKVSPERNLWIWKVKSSLVFHWKRSHHTATMAKAVKISKVTPRRNLWFWKVKVWKLKNHHAPRSASSMQA